MRPLRIDQNSVAQVWTERNQVIDLIADFKNNSIDKYMRLKNIFNF